MTRRLWFGGLRWRLILLISLAVLPSVGLMLAGGIERRDQGAEEMRNQGLHLVRLAVQEQARRVEGARQLLIALSTSSAFRADDTARCVRDVRALVKEYGGLYSEIGWADRSGRVMCHALEGENLSIADRQYFQAALATGRFTVGEFIVGKISRVPVLAFSHPLRDIDGSVRGVIFVNVDLRALSASLEAAARESGGIISILDRNGAVVARSADAARFLGVTTTTTQLAVMRREGELVRTFVGPDGQTRQYAIATLRDSEGAPAMFLTVGRSEAPLLAAVTSRFRDDLLTILVLAIGMIAAAWAGAEWLVRKPVDQLVEATTALANGQLSTRARPVGSKEFATLAESFNRMAEKLEHRDVHLRQGQRLEAIGQLAGGIAHDFNNLLTVIVGCSASLEEQVRTLPGAQRELHDLRAATDRAASLTRQLLAFSRRQFLQPKVLQVNDIVTQMQVMLRRIIGDEISLDVSLDPELGLVRADPAQLEQVIVNLVLNARDAMPHGGVIAVETRNRRLEAGNIDGVAPGEYVELGVADNGAGIDQATQARLFEPFFTTKGPRGTGLGLATVYGIVKQSGGTIRCESAVGRGTRFEILLPMAIGAVPEVDAEKPQEVAGGGTERVLVVEDEPAVRGLIATALQRHGYLVHLADDGVSALEVMRKIGQIDLLVTDVRMPRMNGLVLFQEVQKLSPGLPTLLVSGDSAPDVPESADGMRPLFLQKPFTPAQLLQAAREALSLKALAGGRVR